MKVTGAGALFSMVAACGGAPVAPHPHAHGAPLSLAADARMLVISAGPYVAGSTPEERAAAYDAHRAVVGDDVARAAGWFEDEQERHVEQLPAFRIDLMPVTQAQFAEYVATGHASPPAIDEATWKAQGGGDDYATAVARFVWAGGRPPAGREDHPVVLVTWDEARAYCAWRGALRGALRRLPSAGEFEKAARGADGLAYPWGNTFEADKLNSAVGGPGDTTPVGTYVSGASPLGVLDMAGNVFQWTSTRAPRGQMLAKGSGWHAAPGFGRGASGRGHSPHARHATVGFRCAAEAP